VEERVSEGEDGAENVGENGRENEGENESNAETQRALRIRREEKGLTRRAQRWERRDHGEFWGSEELRAFGGFGVKMENGRVIYSPAKIACGSCLLG